MSVDMYQLLNGIRGYEDVPESVLTLNLLAGAFFVMQHALFVS